jgi:hypothetical protein
VITRRFTRIDLTNASEDYLLKVGEEAYISFNNVSSIPLRIATTNDTFYELHLLNSNPRTDVIYGRVRLFPNNTTYNEFCISVVYRAPSAFNTIYETTETGFYLGASFIVAFALIINQKQYKNVRSISNLYGRSDYNPLYLEASTDWRNTTTEWTSLGTIVYPAPAKGEIIVRRLM